MELATQEVIAVLRNVVAPPAKKRRGSRASETEVRPRAVRVRRCRCGECAKCRENARWDRIFMEKFADPDYYSTLSLRSASPLTSI